MKCRNKKVQGTCGVKLSSACVMYEGYLPSWSSTNLPSDINFTTSEIYKEVEKLKQYVNTENPTSNVKSVNNKIGDVILKTSDLENDSDYTTNDKLNKEIQDRISADNLKLDKPTTNNTPDYVLLADGSTAPKSDFGKVRSVNGKEGDVILKTSDLVNDSNFVTKPYVDTHIVNKANPHNVTKSQIGLGNVDNTSDLNKPISTATQTELNKKLDKPTTNNTPDYVLLADGSTAPKSDFGKVDKVMGVEPDASKNVDISGVAMNWTNSSQRFSGLLDKSQDNTYNKKLVLDNEGNAGVANDAPAEFVKNGVGWSLKYRAGNPTFYGAIGQEAVDFSISKSVNTNMPERFSYGANGFNAAVFGMNNSAMDAGSLVSGVQNRSQGQCNNIMSSNSTIIQDKGTGNFTKKDNGIYSGSYNTIENNRNSTVIGGGNNRMVGKISPVNNMYDMYNAIIGGNYNTLTNSITNTILGGTLNNIIGEEKSRENESYNSNNAIIGGYKNKIITATGTNRQAYGSVIVGGEGNIAQGHYNMVAGYGNNAVTVGEVLVGMFGTIQNTSLSGYDFISNSRMFNVGIGFSNTGGAVTREDGLSVFRNGLVKAPSLTTSLIDSDPKSVITKEYLDIRIPKPPTTGAYTLKSINGVVSWVLN